MPCVTMMHDFNIFLDTSLSLSFKKLFATAATSFALEGRLVTIFNISRQQEHMEKQQTYALNYEIYDFVGLHNFAMTTMMAMMMTPSSR
jgi:hypothetical protein